MRISFSESQQKKKLKRVTTFVQKELPKLSKVAVIRAMFARVTRLGADHLDKALRWGSDPLLHVMPFEEAVAVTSKKQVILSLEVAQDHEEPSGDPDLKKLCACKETTKRGVRPALELYILRGLVLWGCWVKDSDTPSEVLQDKVDEFEIAVNGDTIENLPSVFGVEVGR